MLLDLGLPGGSGFDVLSAVTGRAQRPEIIVVTARDDMQSTVKAIQLGAYEYIVKPVDIDRLREVVRRALDGRDTRGQLEEFVSERAGGQAGDILGKSPQIEEYGLRRDDAARDDAAADRASDRPADRPARPAPRGDA